MFAVAGDLVPSSALIRRVIILIVMMVMIMIMIIMVMMMLGRCTTPPW